MGLFALCYLCKTDGEKAFALNVGVPSQETDNSRPEWKLTFNNMTKRLFKLRRSVNIFTFHAALFNSCRKPCLAK